MYLYYMPSLVKVEEIKDYNWGGARLACLYLLMDALSRGLVASIGGYWRAWEVSHFMLVDLMIITIACDVVMLLS